jgi:xylose dehydrogenase (NAD/NADP)
MVAGGREFTHEILDAMTEISRADDRGRGHSRPEDADAAAVRWGVLGTANIAAVAFLPALLAAGGSAVVVGSRAPQRAADWAAEHGVSRPATYREVIDAPDVDAVYIALPNEQHAEWAAAACAAGKAVLCEKPLTLNAGQAAALVAETGPDARLWESFVFPFHPQTDLLTGLIASGRIGRLREIVSEFHFAVRRPDNIRLQPERGGGALYDVGCYPVRLARLLFASEPTRAAAAMSYGDSGVDLDVAAILDFPQEQRLILSAGMRRPSSTATRLLGSEGELRVSNPFHPLPQDAVELWTGGECVETYPPATPGPGTAFQHAITHIQQVVRGHAEPRHRAVDDAVAQARALDLARAAATDEGRR